jgi:hypothetical protein
VTEISEVRRVPRLNERNASLKMIETPEVQKGQECEDPLGIIYSSHL